MKTGLIKDTTKIEAEGHPPKTIIEHIGRVNTCSEDISIAKMTSPEGWSEPAQVPEFDEYTYVIKGAVTVETEAGTLKVNAGETFFAKRGDRVRYSTPDAGGAEYVAVCTPAFSPDTVHREV